MRLEDEAKNEAPTGDDRVRPGRREAYAAAAEPPRRSLLGRWWLWLLVGLAIQLVPWPAALADAVFLRGTLPLWSSLTVVLADLSGRSVSALLLLSLLVVCGLALLAGVRTRRAALRGLGGVLAGLALTFPFVFGLGYHTTPLEDRLSDVVVAGDGHDDESASGAAGSGDASDTPPRELARQLVLAALNESNPDDQRPSPPVEPSTDMRLEPATPAAAAAECLRRYLPNVVRGPSARVPSRVKAVPEGWLLRIGFSGVISPWLLEPHVDPALPAPAALAVAMHELAHTAGFAREAEAEAVALLAGLACDRNEVRYAAALKAAMSFASELQGEEREAFVDGWPRAAVNDAEVASAIARNYRSRAAADVASRVYDTYLSSQRTGGMSDYARSTDLLVLALTGLRAE